MDPAARRAYALGAYLEACEEELLAFKPGNVSVHSAGHEMTVEDFRRSAAVSAPHLLDPELGLGERIARAVEATRAAVGCNTNLGIVLLAAPLLQAFERCPDPARLRTVLTEVLRGATVEDAEGVYRAIRVAQPGGLGEVPEQDVRQVPDRPLVELMRMAEDRDRIAWQYTHSFADILDFAIPRYHGAALRWGSRDWAAVWVFVNLLSRIPDSHIERKFGSLHSKTVAARMAALEAALASTENPEDEFEYLRAIDQEFKALGLNPGTTADLTVACSLAVRLGF